MVSPRLREFATALAGVLPAFSYTAAAQDTTSSSASSSITAILQIGPVPSSLEASVITTSMTTEPGYTALVVSYQVNCASAISPENDACRALSIYPAIAYHTQGSVWGGTITASSGASAASTTEWRCELGGTVVEGACSSTVMHDGSTVSVANTSLDSCYVYQHSVPLVLTAGVEKLLITTTSGSSSSSTRTATRTYSTPTYAVSDLLDYYASDLSSLGCSARPTLQATSATATATDTPSSSDSGASATTSTTGSGVASLRDGPGWMFVGMGVVAAHLGYLLLE